MEQETIDTTNVAEAAEQPKVEVRQYDYAHLTMFCGKCGSRYILEKDVKKGTGIQINLPPVSNAELILVCKDCGNKMGMFYVESDKKDNEEISNDIVTEDNGAEAESVQSESIEAITE